MAGNFLALLLKTIRPILGPATCKFYPSCTDFACEELREKPFLMACKTIYERLIRCI